MICLVVSYSNSLYQLLMVAVQKLVLSLLKVFVNNRRKFVHLMQQLIQQVIKNCRKEKRKKNGKPKLSPYQLYQLLT